MTKLSDAIAAAFLKKALEKKELKIPSLKITIKPEIPKKTKELNQG